MKVSSIYPGLLRPFPTPISRLTMQYFHTSFIYQIKFIQRIFLRFLSDKLNKPKCTIHITQSYKGFIKREHQIPNRYHLGHIHVGEVPIVYGNECWDPVERLGLYWRSDGIRRRSAKRKWRNEPLRFKVRNHGQILAVLAISFVRNYSITSKARYLSLRPPANQK